MTIRAVGPQRLILINPHRTARLIDEGYSVPCFIGRGKGEVRIVFWFTPGGLWRKIRPMKREKEQKDFDKWPERYDAWFETPIGALIKSYEAALLMGLLRPAAGERILDAGCGTGIFSEDILCAGAHVAGIELSLPMLRGAEARLKAHPFHAVQGDMAWLPFSDNTFDKAVSVTALEFIADAQGAVMELFRVTRPGGYVVVATLNSLGPWAERRKEAASKGHPLFRKAIFRSPREIMALAPVQGTVKTAIFFDKHDPLARAREKEREGQAAGLETGAFVAARWKKPVT